MTITAESIVADIATHAPATIAVFQRHHIDFCCGGKSPLAECAPNTASTPTPCGQLEAPSHPQDNGPSWRMPR